MTPMPNNGTLRLPLSVVGLHDDETVLEQPGDPTVASTSEAVTASITSIIPTVIPSSVGTSTAVSVGANPVEDDIISTTSVLIISTPLPIETPSTSLIGVDPVEDEPKRPTRPTKPEKPKKPEKPQPPKKPQPPQKPQGEPAKDTDKPDEAHKDQNSSWWSVFQETLDWVKEQVNDLVDHISKAGN
jgi:hypothetical protein